MELLSYEKTNKSLFRWFGYPEKESNRIVISLVDPTS